MAKAVVRWSLFFAALLVVGPIAYALVGTLRAPDGGPGVTPILSTSPIIGLLRGVVAVGMCCGFGYLVCRWVSPRWAYFCAGVAMIWAAAGTGTLVDVLRAAPSDRTLWMLGLEGLVLGLPVVAFSWYILPHSPHAPAPPGGSRLSHRDPQPVVVGTVAFVFAIAGGAVSAWLIGQNLLKGQTIAAAVVGGLVGAMAGHLAAPSAPPWAFIAGIVALAVAGPVVAGLVERSGQELLRATFTARVLPPVRLLPLDWLAGGLVGVPIGLAWAGAFVDKKH